MADSVFRSPADRSLALDALIETGNPFTNDEINVLRKKQLIGSGEYNIHIQQTSGDGSHRIPRL